MDSRMVRAQQARDIAAMALFVWLACGSVALAWNPLIIGGRCASSNRSCRTTIGNAGGSGSCCDPQSSGVASCVQSNSCKGGTAYRWPGVVNWSFNPNGLPGGFAGKSVTAYENSLRAAWSVWASPSCTSFQHKYDGQTTTGPSTRDKKVVAFFATPSQWAQFGFGSRTLAVTRPATTTNGTAQIIDADIIYNPNPSGRKWGIHPNVAPDEMDFQDVSAHEIGHALGFGHAHPRSSLMYYAVRGVGPVYSGLPQDEQDAICATYPGSGSQPECQVDSDCDSKGSCMACQSGTCVERQISSEAKSCKGCRSNADCGGLACVSLGGKMRCLQPCVAGCCPTGTTCQTQLGQPLCVPTAGVCAAPSCTVDTECGPGEACVSGTCQDAQSQPNPCGDGTCNPAQGENCGTCAADCACAATQLCQNNQCQSSTPSNTCGNGSCDLDKGENCGSCPQDCACTGGTVCQGTTCVGNSSPCGDGVCNSAQGENCGTCAQDCGCASGQRCQAGACVQTTNPTPQCSNTAPCPAGSTCVNGQCIAQNAGGNGTNPQGSPQPGAIGGPCLDGGFCLSGGICHTQASGQSVCLQKVSGASAGTGLTQFRARGYGCSLSPEPTTPSIAWLLSLLVFLLPRKRG